MGRERDSEYYNELYSKRKLVSYKKSQYLPLWREVIKRIPKDSTILDLGMGHGMFFAFLADSIEFTWYYGVDFSEEAITQAYRRRMSGNDMSMNSSFLCEDVFKCHIPEHDICLIMETLEHLNEDIELIKRLKGSEVIITVPTFLDPAHTRVFRTEESVTDRYSEHIEMKDLQRIKKWWLFNGVVK